MKVYKTNINCRICDAELKLVEDVTYNDFDGEIVKDVEHYFECPNGCDGEYETMDDYNKKIDEIISKNCSIDCEHLDVDGSCYKTGDLFCSNYDYDDIYGGFCGLY